MKADPITRGRVKECLSGVAAKELEKVCGAIDVLIESHKQTVRKYRGIPNGDKIAFVKGQIEYSISAIAVLKHTRSVFGLVKQD